MKKEVDYRDEKFQNLMNAIKTKDETIASKDEEIATLEEDLDECCHYAQLYEEEQQCSDQLQGELDEMREVAERTASEKEEFEIMYHSEKRKVDLLTVKAIDQQWLLDTAHASLKEYNKISDYESLELQQLCIIVHLVKQVL